MSPARISKSDKLGKCFEIGISCDEEFQSVLEMYRSFFPKPASQGLPPQDPVTCQNWLKALFKIGINGLAWRDDKVIGHVATIPNVKGKLGELVTFVSQDHRNRGVGTELTLFILEEFRQRGFEVVWVTVRVSDFIPIKLYRRVGFEYCDADNYERVMAIKLM